MIKLKFINKITHLIVICILSIFNQAQAKEKIDYSKYFSDPNEILFINAVVNYPHLKELACKSQQI